MAIDLDRVALSSAQVAQLYKQSLVVTGEPMAGPANVYGGPMGGAAGSVEDGAETPKRGSSPGIEASARPEPAREPLRYLGENKRKILLLVRDPENVYLAETAFNFLLSILNACGLSMEAVALVNTARIDLSLPEVAETLESQFVLLFGIDPVEMDLPMVFPTYQVQPFGSRTYLAADDLAGIAGERTQKGRLWACLKQLFDI